MRAGLSASPYQTSTSRARGQTIQTWFADFTDALGECRLDRGELAPGIAEPVIWPIHSATTGGVRYH